MVRVRARVRVKARGGVGVRVEAGPRAVGGTTGSASMHQHVSVNSVAPKASSVAACPAARAAASV